MLPSFSSEMLWINSVSTFDESLIRGFTFNGIISSKFCIFSITIIFTGKYLEYITQNIKKEYKKMKIKKQNKNKKTKK